MIRQALALSTAAVLIFGIVFAHASPSVFYIGDVRVSERVIEREGKHYVAIEDLAKAMEAKIGVANGKVTLEYDSGSPGAVWLAGPKDEKGFFVPGKWVGRAPVSTQAPVRPAASPAELRMLGDPIYQRDGIFANITGSVVNPGPNQAKGVLILFNLYDNEGKQVGNAQDYIDNVEPRQTWKFRALVVNPERVKEFRLKEIRANLDQGTN